MSKENYINKIKDLPESLRQFIGLIFITLIVIVSFSILNGIFGQGDDLVKRMKLEEERIAEEKKLSELISKLPSGILVSFDGTDHYKLTNEVYEQVCKATKLIPQRAIMGANFLNFRAHELYTINGNKIDETFVKWDEEKNKCFAGFTVSGNNVGVDESITIIVIVSFSILNGIFGQGDDLVKRMKLEEERIAEEKKLSELISKLPSGILVSFDGTDHYKLTDDVYEQVCKATKLIPQRAIMGANFLNFRAHELYTINGNKIDETFVKWDEEKNKCFAGFTVSGNNVGVDESITISGEALSFLSTGIDTRVYFIKNF